MRRRCCAGRQRALLHCCAGASGTAGPLMAHAHAQRPVKPRKTHVSADGLDGALQRRLADHRLLLQHAQRRRIGHRISIRQQLLLLLLLPAAGRRRATTAASQLLLVCVAGRAVLQRAGLGCCWRGAHEPHRAPHKLDRRGRVGADAGRQLCQRHLRAHTRRRGWGEFKQAVRALKPLTAREHTWVAEAPHRPTQHTSKAAWKSRYVSASLIRAAPSRLVLMPPPPPPPAAAAPPSLPRASPPWLSRCARVSSPAAPAAAVVLLSASARARMKNSAPLSTSSPCAIL